MTKLEAVQNIVWDARSERTITKAASRRVWKSLQALGLTREESVQVLISLEHCQRDGKPWLNFDPPWLAQ